MESPLEPLVHNRGSSVFRSDVRSNLTEVFSHGKKSALTALSVLRGLILDTKSLPTQSEPWFIPDFDGERGDERRIQRQ